MKSSDKNIKKEPLSIWSAYLDKGYEDPYLDYKEKIAVKTEILIGEIANELLKNGVTYTSDVAKKVAVNLIMEQMLIIQYDNCPDGQKAMIINLFCDHPSTMDFKVDLLEKFKEKEREKTLWFKLKKMFKFKKACFIFNKIVKYKGRLATPSTMNSLINK